MLPELVQNLRGKYERQHRIGTLASEGTKFQSARQE
jgi:hypothetical protein